MRQQRKRLGEEVRAVGSEQRRTVAVAGELESRHSIADLRLHLVEPALDLISGRGEDGRNVPERGAVPWQTRLGSERLDHAERGEVLADRVGAESIVEVQRARALEQMVAADQQP